MLKGLVILSLLLFFLGYIFYGRFLEKQYQIDEKEEVPSKKFFDGVDFVPTNKFILLGHHFSSIAGAGPIVGPIIAGMCYGWLPAFIWIILGCIFVGGMHDFSSLIASLRHQGKSIGEITKNYMGKKVYKVFLLFIWFALVYVITVFADLAATSFSKEPSVAQVNICYILIALIFGLTIYKFKTNLFLTSIFYLILIGISIILNLQKDILVFSKETWILILMFYSFIASILPVWILLQPRDYLSSFLLYTVLIVGALGTIFGNYRISYPYYLSFQSSIGPLFPFLFITVACGAISGFHSLVASGTTSKQLDNIKNAKLIAYGGMLLEGVIAIIALSTLIIFSQTDKTNKTPLDIFSLGISKFTSVIGLNPKIGFVFGYLIISAFILTTLDTATRICRYVWQEIFEMEGSSLKVRIFATLASLSLPLVLLHIKFYSPEGKIIPAWKKIWPIFGTTNQLLAALVLLSIYVWRKKAKFKNNYFLFLPVILMFAITLTGLFYIIFKAHGIDIITLIGAILLVLAFYMIIESIKATTLKYND